MGLSFDDEETMLESPGTGIRFYASPDSSLGVGSGSVHKEPESGSDKVDSQGGDYIKEIERWTFFFDCPLEIWCLSMFSHVLATSPSLLRRSWTIIWYITRISSRCVFSPRSASSWKPDGFKWSSGTIYLSFYLGTGVFNVTSVCVRSCHIK